MRVLVVGDIMLDAYTYVSTERMAEEAQIPVWDVISSSTITQWPHQDRRLGGAGNVALNVKKIFPDASVYLMGLGDGSLQVIARENGINTDYVIGSRAMVKQRFVQNGKIIARLDYLQKFSDGDVRFFEMMVCGCAEKFDVVIFSDYDKGTLTDKIIKIFLSVAPIVAVDSKRLDLTPFTGATVLKVNSKEFTAQQSSQKYYNVVSLFKHVVVTRGKHGADLISCEKFADSDGLVVSSYKNNTEHFPTIPQKEVDVTGCGDTHTAALAIELFRTGDIRSAVRFANVKAAQVVQMLGTSAPIS